MTCRAGYRDSASPLLKSLHWLPVSQRIDFKVSLITFKALTLGQPRYLSDLIKWYSPTRSLRSTNDALLYVPPCQTNLASRAFAVYAPTLWNSLPVELRKSVSICMSIASFKSNLKTFFFGKAFEGVT